MRARVAGCRCSYWTSLCLRSAVKLQPRAHNIELCNNVRITASHISSSLWSHYGARTDTGDCFCDPSVKLLFLTALHRHEPASSVQSPLCILHHCGTERGGGFLLKLTTEEMEHEKYRAWFMKCSLAMQRSDFCSPETNTWLLSTSWITNIIQWQCLIHIWISVWKRHIIHLCVFVYY